ncbi:hypothetical protein PHLGIDRAFT_79424, partial [Phlebiopsis gigantea 11061_1 CR5-6]
PLGIYIYADKSKLSTFGTQQGYPRHGVGLGGGHVIGLLPIIKETSEDSGKPAFINFKRRVWHTAMSEILGCFKKLASLGLTIHCGDDIIRRFFPFFDILAGDYEEQ